MSPIPLPPALANIALTAHDVAIAHHSLRTTGTLTAIAVIAAIFDLYRSRSAIALLLIAGGGLAICCEAYVDIVGGCFYPIIGNTPFIDLMGRPVPGWVLPAYMATFGAEAMIIYMILRNGTGKLGLWLCYLIPVLANIVLEVSLLNSSDNLYIYYGNQPLIFFKFPLFWPFVNVLGFYAAAVATVLLRSYLTGFRQLLVPFITPLCYTAAFGFAGFPSALVINSDVSAPIVQLAGLCSIGLALLAVWGSSQFLTSAARAQQVSRFAMS